MKIKIILLFFSVFIFGKGTSQINFDLNTTVTSPFLEGGAGANAEIGVQKFSLIGGVIFDVREYIPNLASAISKGSKGFGKLDAPVFQVGFRFYNNPYYGTDQVFVECKYKFAKESDEYNIAKLYINVGYKHMTNRRFYTETFIGVTPRLTFISGSTYDAYPSFFPFQLGFRVGYRLLGSNSYANIKTSKKKSRRSKNNKKGRTAF